MESKIMEVVTKAYESYDFYRWFYNKHNVVPSSEVTYDDLPTLTKYDLLEFEDKGGYPFKGIPLYEFYTTFFSSGTSGKPLKIIWPESEFLSAWVHPFFRQKYMSELLDQEVPRVIGPAPPPVSLAIKLASEKEGGKYVGLVGEKMFDIEFIYNKVKEERANILFDLVGYLTQHLVEHNFPFEELGIKAIITVTLPPENILKKLREIYGRNCILNVYASVEMGHLACSCPFSTRLHLHQMIGDSPRRFLHVEGKDGKVRETGSGKLVITWDLKSFPWFKYSVGDNVTIERDECGCGFKGRFVIVHGRDIERKLGSIFGPLIDVINLREGVEQIFPSIKHLEVYVRGSIGKKSNQLFFIIFVEGEKSRSILDREASKKLLKHCTGIIDPQYIDFIPVVQVQKGSIPFGALATKFHKKQLLDLVQQTPSDEIMPLLDLLRDIGIIVEF